MTSITEASLALIESAPPATTATKVLVGSLGLAAAASAVHYISPTRLTGILVSDIADTEKVFLDAVEAGLLSKEAAHIAEALARLQKDVSEIRSATLSDILSYRAMFCGFFKGRALTVLQSIREVRALKIRIEILEEEQLHGSGADSVVRKVSARRRHTDSASLKCKY